MRKELIEIAAMLDKPIKAIDKMADRKADNDLESMWSKLVVVQQFILDKAKKK